MIPSSEGDTVICVGTVFFKFGEKEPSQGRLLLFKAELDARLSRKKRQLKQISELNVQGCVYALARVNGLLVAAIGPTVGSLFHAVSVAESGTVTGFSVQN
jgi:DNA damage-binding protein 1